MNNIDLKSFLFLLLAFAIGQNATGQLKNPDVVREMIDQYKKDPRGPYRDIRWFCQDGTTRPAKDPCPDKPGNQRARYKEEVITLAKKEHIFLGQILTTTPYSEFWDSEHAQSRLKQYQLEQYLQRNYNGWINRRAQYYRGAVQAEDENSWGIGFLKWLLEDTSTISSQYFLIRQSAIDIPHTGDNRNTQLIRSLSKEIADELVSFSDLRVKIHGSPDEGDIERVKSFMRQNKEKIPNQLMPKFDRLLREMSTLYQPFEVSELSRYLKQLPEASEAAVLMANFMQRYPELSSASEKCQILSHTGYQLRHQLTAPMKALTRLAIIDISLRFEQLMGIEASKWEPNSLREILAKVYCLSEAAAAFGYIEIWEWQQFNKNILIPTSEEISLKQLEDWSENGRRLSDWGAGMFRAHYMPVINMYQSFEPLASGFYDDRIRSSILLNLGNAVSRLGDVFSKKAGFSNNVMGIPDPSTVRGLNPGFTVGELVVVTSLTEDLTLSPDKIYVFREAPTDLKPVAGIATVTEGNLVSHVQLLARNLGIPNAVISEQNMESLKELNGERVFYAVSNKGTVIMKQAEMMDAGERALFEKKKRKEEKIDVPVEQMRLENPKVLNLRNVDATQSGKTCGPKAANLGQLKKIFPENVVEGLVLPFSVFRQHMDQTIPGYETTYWTLMNNIFETGDKMRSEGEDETKVETFILEGLDSLRTLIKNMPLLPSFKESLEQQFIEVLGKPMGNIPVFIRSDTNMEDLKDFTGAGLNLTVFNVLNVQKIFQGIRDVWASPYTERSYKWRQRYLNNPENVFPSILIIPSVNADYSGVLITKGVTTGDEEDITVAFNRGVGGAVDGQAAETWLLNENSTNHLITPARELFYLTIPNTGGSIRRQASFENRVLSSENLDALISLVDEVLQKLPGTPGIHSEGPFDMELGFKDNKIWLFQIRPFVENKQAAASEYLQSITPEFDGDQIIPLEAKL